MSSAAVELTRKELYEEIWSISVAGVARKYGIPYARCLAQIKAAQIPIPPSGYWTKINFGKQVEQEPLPGNPDATITLVKDRFLQVQTAMRQEQTTPATSDTSSPAEPISQKSSEVGEDQIKKEIQTGTRRIERLDEKAAQLEFLSEEERQRVLNAASQILLPQEHAKMRPEIVAHRKRVADWNKRKRQQEQKLGPNWNRRKREVPPSFSEGISEEQQPRVFRLIDALAKAMIPLGWTLTADLQFTLGQDSVALVFSEATDQVLHTLTKEENLRLLEYEEQRKKHAWDSKPKIRKYDAVYNGRLSVSVNGMRAFRDCRSYVLEDRLGDMMLVIYREAERRKQARLAQEEAERQRQEQERRQEILRKRYNLEVDRTLALVNCAADYETACRIRSYVSAMEKAHPDQDLSEWASWARAKADWYDPTIAREDELLGKREHDKNQQNKEPRYKDYWC